MNSDSLLKRIIKLICSVVITCMVTSASAQHFKYKAALPAIDSSSFYKVEIPPVIAGKGQIGFADLRVVDQKRHENPYIIKSSEAGFTEKSFEELKIISKHKGADNQTHIIIENHGKRSLQNLLLFIKNTEAQRTVTLSGAEDTTNWYVIKEGLLLENLSINNLTGTFVQSISFPSVDYRYLKITILGKNVLPVNITRAGITSERSFNGKYVQLPTPSIKTIDSSNKKSYVYLYFNATYLVDKLELVISGVKFYKRNIAIYPNNNLLTNPDEFTIASNTPASVHLQMKVQSLLLVIENEDNPPLQVDAASAWQLNKYLLTYLEKGEKYTLSFGDSTALPPAYDLGFFADSIPQTLPVIHTGDPEPNPASNFPVDDKKAGRPIVLWVVIIAVLGLLLFACYKLIKDMEKKKVENNA